MCPSPAALIQIRALPTKRNIPSPRCCCCTDPKPLMFFFLPIPVRPSTPDGVQQCPKSLSFSISMWTMPHTQPKLLCTCSSCSPAGPSGGRVRPTVVLQSRSASPLLLLVLQKYQAFAVTLSIPICHQARSFGSRPYSEIPSSDVQKSAEVPREKSSHSSLSMSTMSDGDDVFQTAVPAASAAIIPAHKFAEPTDVPFAAVAASQPVTVERPTKVPPAMPKGFDKNLGSSPFVQRPVKVVQRESTSDGRSPMSKPPAIRTRLLSVPASEDESPQNC